MEFDLTLQDGEVAVLHTGTLADGSPCIVLLEASISSHDIPRVVQRGLDKLPTSITGGQTKDPNYQQKE